MSHNDVIACQLGTSHDCEAKMDSNGKRSRVIPPVIGKARVKSHKGNSSKDNRYCCLKDNSCIASSIVTVAILMKVGREFLRK